jgi:hypothetical protein
MFKFRFVLITPHENQPMVVWITFKMKAFFLFATRKGSMNLVCITGAVQQTKCRHCSSTTSYKECQAKSVLRTCSSDQTTCYKADVQNTGTRIYGKGCVSSSQCVKSRLPFCRNNGYTYSNCTVHCCTGEGCNAGSVLGVSVVILLACVVARVLLVA